MFEPPHNVSFTAEDGRMFARCSCGWIHSMQPWRETASSVGAMIMDIGFQHSLGDQELNARPEFARAPTA